MVGPAVIEQRIQRFGLRLKPGVDVEIEVRKPDGFDEELAPLPAGVTVLRRLGAGLDVASPKDRDTDEDMDFAEPSGLRNAVTPTTAFARRRATVDAGSSMSTFPALIAATRSAGRASASTLRPRLSAIFGLTPGPTPPSFWPTMASCSRSLPPQNSSEPNVS